MSLSLIPGSNKWDFGALHTPATDRTSSETSQQIGMTGTFTALKVRIETGVPERNVFVEVEITDNQGRVQAKLMSGYVDIGNEPFGTGSQIVKEDWFIRLRSWSSMAVAPTLTLRGTIQEGEQVGGWTGTSEKMSDGLGSTRSITGTDPAAPLAINEATPSGALWALRAVRFTLVTDVNVANRVVFFDIRDSANLQEARIPMGIVQTASQTIGYNGFIGSSKEGTAIISQVGWPLPDRIQMPEAFDFNIDASAGQATDNFGAPQFEVDEWLRPAS